MDMWEVMHGTSAAVGFHLCLMAQPPGLPEQMITASADAFFGYFLDQWTDDPAAIPADVRVAYLAACRDARDCPTTGLGRRTRLRGHRPVVQLGHRSGPSHRHFMTEVAPADIATALCDLRRR
ncbi:hypothetical protein [Nocardia australiensis]|uniref:hypothetical protein n=1 Tax=Nocardia australiensis TaxID=2887191 RepID=UPI001D13A58F|nr:hypothetical protein [Nocardia australiensis]